MATNGIVLIKPTSVAKTGGSSTATINAGGSVTFTTCESLSLNGVFSSTYDNYIIDMRLKTAKEQNQYLRFRASGTDNSTASSYTSQRLRATSTTISVARQSQDYGFTGTSTTGQAGFQIFVYGPYLAQPTAYRSIIVDDTSGARIDDYAVTHNQSTAYDGVTLLYASTTFTGLVKVYGLVK